MQKKRTCRLTPQQHMDIVRLYVEGAKMDYIAALFGTTRSSVFKAARRAGVPHRWPGGRKPRDVVEEPANLV